jgi:hypothetical protein
MDKGGALEHEYQYIEKESICANETEFEVSFLMKDKML